MSLKAFGKKKLITEPTTQVRGFFIIGEQGDFNWILTTCGVRLMPLIRNY